MPLTQASFAVARASSSAPRPLVGRRYAECVEIDEAASEQRALLLDAINARVGFSQGDTRLRLLSIGSGEFDAALAARDLTWDLQRIDARLDASGCPRVVAPGVVTSDGGSIADFIAQVEIERLSAAMRAQTYAYRAEIARTAHDGSRCFLHPVGLFTARRASD